MNKMLSAKNLVKHLDKKKYQDATILVKSSAIKNNNLEIREKKRKLNL